MTDVVTTLRGGALPQANIPDERIVGALRKLLELAERGQIEALTFVAYSNGAPVMPIGAVICRTEGEARAILGLTMVLQSEIVAGLK